MHAIKIPQCYVQHGRQFNGWMVNFDIIHLGKIAHEEMFDTETV